MTVHPNFFRPDPADPRLARPVRHGMLIDGRSVEVASGWMIDRYSPGHVGAVVGT